jgi:hypothetical protein
MNEHDQDPSEDYGYDLAYEAMGTSEVPDGRPATSTTAIRQLAARSTSTRTSATTRPTTCDF